MEEPKAEETPQINSNRNIISYVKLARSAKTKAHLIDLSRAVPTHMIFVSTSSTKQTSL
jgi:hypothetical protein